MHNRAARKAAYPGIDWESINPLLSMVKHFLLQCSEADCGTKWIKREREIVVYSGPDTVRDRHSESEVYSGTSNLDTKEPEECVPL